MHNSAVFRICILGELTRGWCDCFGVQSMAVERGESGISVTTVTTEPVDQAALIGMLNHLYSLGLPLMSLEYLP